MPSPQHIRQYRSPAPQRYRYNSHLGTTRRSQAQQAEHTAWQQSDADQEAKTIHSARSARTSATQKQRASIPPEHTQILMVAAEFIRQWLLLAVCISHHGKHTQHFSSLQHLFRWVNLTPERYAFQFLTHLAFLFLAHSLSLPSMEMPIASMSSIADADLQFLIQLLMYVMGQRVTLDVQLPPPWMRRIPGSEPPLEEIYRFHLHRYQTQWPIEISGHRLGRFSFRVIFTHLAPHQCPFYASVCREWYSAVCVRTHNMGHVDYRAPRPLPRQYEVVDTVIFHESQSEFHGQVDSDLFSTLNFSPLSAPTIQRD